MIKRRRRFISWLLTIVFVFSMMPISSYAENPTDHDHSGWIELNQDKLQDMVDDDYYDFDGLYSSGSVLNVYLTEDISLDKPLRWGNMDTTLNLCLNDHVIDAGDKDAFIITNHTMFNLIDCGNTEHFFTSTNNDNCFDKYESNGYDPTGKTEGTDYIRINGGAIINAKQALFIESGSEVNLYSCSIVGCNSSSYTIRVTGNSYLNIHNSVIAGNRAHYVIEVRVEDQAEVVISDNSTINYNKAYGSIIAIDTENKLSIIDSKIQNNVMEYIEPDLYYAVSCWNSELLLSGDVIISDNFYFNDGFPSGKQSNLCVFDEHWVDTAFDGDELADNSLIGVSLYSQLDPSESTTVCKQTDIPVTSFFSDDLLYYVEKEDNNLKLTHRLTGQPSEDNDYTCIVNDNGVTASYQWYDASVSSEVLNNESFRITDSNGSSYENDTWKPIYMEDDAFLYFSFNINAGETFKCDIEFDDSVFEDEALFSVAYWPSLAPAVIKKISPGGNVSMNISEEGEYSIITGCFGQETPEENLKIKNARLEKIVLGNPLNGKTQNYLSGADKDTSYLCKITLMDASGATQSLLSDFVTLSEDIPEYYVVTFNTCGYGENPDDSTIQEGAAISAPLAPTATGLLFCDWYLEPDYENVYDFSSPVNDDFTLYAKWRHEEPSGVEGGINKITGVDSTMEYKLSDKDTWNLITSTTLSDLEAGEYEVRIKANDNVFESEPITVTVTDPTPTPDPDPDPQPNPLKTFVNRMFETIKGEEADENEVTELVALLNDKSYDGASLAYDLTNSDEFKNRNLSDEHFLIMLYKAFFDRNPDEEGYNFWLELLKNETNREEVLAGFVNSEEFTNLCKALEISRGFMLTDGTVAEKGVKAFVEHCYIYTLGREGEQAGLDAWMSLIATGKMTAKQVITEEFFHSDEFIKKELTDEEYVEILYASLLGRNPDQEGFEFWINLLEDGATRDDVLEGFANSEEFANVLVAYEI